MDGNNSGHDQQFINFENFSPVHSGGQALLDIGIPDQQSYNLSNPPLADNITISTNLQRNPEPEEVTSSSPSFWTIKYYQKYFNVTTSEVVEKIRKSMLPSPTDNYLITYVRPNPDLYGPFWICVTLIFTIAINGNIANYLQTQESERRDWKYNFHLVSKTATCIFLYAWLWPLAIWSMLRWTRTPYNAEDGLIETNMQQLGLTEIICLFGYSLSIYIPVTFLWTIQESFIQWALVLVVTLISGGILLLSVSPVISGKYKYIYMGSIFGMNVLLAVGFMLIVFYSRDLVTESTIEMTSTTTMTIKPKLEQLASKQNQSIINQ